MMHMDVYVMTSSRGYPFLNAKICQIKSQLLKSSGRGIPYQKESCYYTPMNFHV